MWTNEHGYFFGIVDKASQGLVGETVLGLPRGTCRHGSFGIVIWDKACWNRELGKKTVQLMVQCGFDTLNLVSISLGVDAFNQRTRHIYDTLGFLKIGRLREHIFFQGAYNDLVLWTFLIMNINGSMSQTRKNQKLNRAQEKHTVYLNTRWICGTSRAELITTEEKKAFMNNKRGRWFVDYTNHIM